MLSVMVFYHEVGGCFCIFVSFSVYRIKKKKQWLHSFSIIKIEQTYSKHCEYVKKAAGLTNKTNNVAI